MNIINMQDVEQNSKLVTTELGLTPESELEVQLNRTEDGGSWTITRTFTYTGSLHPHARGRVVRQDVWVTMKNGIQSGVQSGV
jgi:hypothetical protein